MTQADFTVANQTFPNTRAEINTSLQALATNSAGNSAPSTTFANQWWFDSDGNTLYMRNKDNDAWVTVLTIGATSDKVESIGVDDLTFADNSKLILGTGGDLEIYHDGSNSIISDAGAGSLEIQSNGAGVFLQKSASEYLARFLTDGSVDLYYDNVKKFETTANGITVTGTASVVDDISIIGATPSITFTDTDNNADAMVYNASGNLYLEADKNDEQSDSLMRFAIDDVPVAQWKTSELVFNEESNNTDFRVESNGNDYMLFVDGGNNRVGFGTSAPTQHTEIVLNSTGSVPTDSEIGSSNAGVAMGLGIHNESNSATYTGIALETRTSQASRWLIANEWQSGYHGDLLFRRRNGASTSAEAMRIQSNGTIKIGSAPADNVMMFVQHQYGNTGTAGFYHQSPTSSDDTSHFFARSTRAASSAYRFFQGQSNNGGDDEVIIRGDGQGYIDGSWNGGGADYAEYFEWKDGNSSSENRIGYSVVLDGNKIVKATDSDDASKIIGVISANPAIVGDTDIGRWKQKYLRDDYNNFIMEDKKTYEWRETIETKDDDGVVINTENKIHSYYEGDIPDGITVPDNAEENTQSIKKLNPDWNKDTTYVSREDRKEWDTVGLMGKLRLKKGQPTGTNWIKMREISETVEEWLVR